MGGRPSRVASGLKEPLLPLHQWQVVPGLPSRGPSPSCSQSCPASFKAGRPRKTRDFIEDELTRSTTRPVWEIADTDPRLLDEEKTMQAITEQVATLLARYALEGKGKQEDKDDDEFHEEHFLRRRLCCCPFRSRMPSPSKEAILEFLTKLADSLYFCKQVVVLCAIYIERLIQRTDTVITTGNWRSLVTAGMLIASKVWEDIHPWNADFEECLAEIAGIRYRHGALYSLESLFLDKLRWRVFVDGEIYAAYFFSLREGRDEGDAKARKKPRLVRHHSDMSRMTPLIEDEPLVESETDAEKSLSSPPDRYDFSNSTGSRDSSTSQLHSEDVTNGSGDGMSNTDTLTVARSCWRLDAGNPHIGSLRHAPRALPPSKHIDQSKELLWAHEIVSKTASLLGPVKSYSEAHTLSGATGNQLQHELLKYLHKKRGEDQAHDRAGELTLSMLEENWPAA